jgi:hypothetical protein
MKMNLITASAVALLCLSNSVAFGAEPDPSLSCSIAVPARAAVEPSEPLVQLAILLDTSSSMEGLIEQTKGQLWKIVNQFIDARQGGKRPQVQVALYEYGKSSLAAKEGFIRQIQPLTNDLDKISEELFALKTNGGEEYCGWVIREAVRNLAWSKSHDDLKVIFIAGNEPFTQGPIDYRESCKAAIERGIIVNTIHCGTEQEGISGNWQNGAMLAEGKYMFIDQNKAVVHFEAPQDKEIAQLGEELNKTYIAFGSAGKESQQRQRLQDMNASVFAASGSAVNRALCKASDNYRNGSWDLVDATKDGKVNLADLKQNELPPELKDKSAAECAAYVQGKAEERARLQKRIQELNASRSKFVAEQTAKHDKSGGTVDAVMISAIREQATKRNYQFTP